MAFDASTLKNAAIASRCGLIIAYPRSRGGRRSFLGPLRHAAMLAPLASSPSFRPIGCGLPRSAGLASRFLPPTPLTGQAREIGIERCLNAHGIFRGKPRLASGGQNDAGRTEAYRQRGGRQGRALGRQHLALGPACRALTGRHHPPARSAGHDRLRQRHRANLNDGPAMVPADGCQESSSQVSTSELRLHELRSRPSTPHQGTILHSHVRSRLVDNRSANRASRSSDPAHAKIFHFEVVLEAMAGTLPPDTGLFYPAEGCRFRGHASRVDANHAIFQGLGHTPDTLQI